jgi:pSer/pThr/pTyr-binding forkhead associated (FHA) protein
MLHVGATGGSGTTVRLDWTEGQPSLTVMDDTQQVQVNVNGTPVEPQVWFPIKAGDIIRIGGVQLTWHAEAEIEADVESEPEIGAEQETQQGPKIETLIQMEAPTEKPLSEPSTAQTQVGKPPPSPRMPSVPDVPATPVYNLIVHTPQWNKEIQLKGETVRIGRAPDNDIYINDNRISRYHAKLVRQERGYEIIDLDSANGLRIENERIFQKLLSDGDVVWIARDISLTYRTIQPAPKRRGGKATGETKDVAATEKKAEDRTVVAGKPQTSQETEASSDVDATVVAAGREPPAAPPPEKASREVGIDETVVAPQEITPEDTVVASRPEAGVPPTQTSEAPTQVSLPTAPSGPETTDDVLDDVDQTIVEPKGAVPAPSMPLDATVVASAKKPPVPPAIPAGEETVVSGERTAQAETEWLDVSEILERDPNLKIESGTIVRNTQIPHLVIHLPERTWEAQFTQDRMTLGRDEDNDVTIPDSSVSRHHAWVERRGRDFVIHEDQSRNGVWLGRQRIEEHTLRDGDILSLGRAKVIFKAGFTSDDLTLIGPPRIDGKPMRRPVVFVPGMMGSELWLGSERLWPNTKLIISNPEIYSLPGDPRIEPRGIVSDVVVVPGILKQEQYSRLGDYLVAGLGYQRGQDLLEFAYDWRQDVRLSAQRLAETIERWDVQAPVTIIAHSLGTLVTRYYVEKLGGKKQVERIVLMGGPHYGTPKAISVILTGPGMLPFGLGDERMRNVLSTFPSAYQILPIYPSVIDQEGKYISVLKDDSWLPPYQRPFLQAARSFRRELGFTSSVPSVSIFGYGLKTILRAKIHRRPDGQWGKVDFIEDSAGDLSVPSGSAVLKESEIHPVLQEHGSLYVDDDVKMRLKVELTRSTTWQSRKGKGK